MTLKPNERFKLKQLTKDSKFEGLELLVHNNGPNTVEVSVEEDTIVIKAVKKEENKCLRLQ